MNSVYAQRRARLASQLGKGGIAVIPTAPERQRNRDNSYLYRHDSYFYYLTGFTEPNACLVLSADGTSTLFCQPKDLEREVWDGYRLGPDAAVGSLGVQAAHSITELPARIARLLENTECVFYPFATHEGLAAQVEGWLNKVRARVRFGAMCPTRQRDLCELLDEMRLVKDDHELAIMRRAGIDPFGKVTPRTLGWLHVAAIANFVPPVIKDIIYVTYEGRIGDVRHNIRGGYSALGSRDDLQRLAEFAI